MGICQGHLKLLLTESAREQFKGSLLTMGRMDVIFDYQYLIDTALKIGVPLNGNVEPTLSSKMEHAEQGYVSDKCLFDSLGFSELVSLDISPYENAQYLFDLNSPDLPDDLTNRFDVIIDGGTSEHIFHIPNLFNNIFKMLKVGGRIIHFVPASNYLDHGYYMFSPSCLWDFYQINKYDINAFLLCHRTTAYNAKPWLKYTPGVVDHLSFRGLDDKAYYNYCVATKNKYSTGDKIPMQGNVIKNAILSNEENNEPVVSSGSNIGNFYSIYRSYSSRIFQIAQTLHDKGIKKVGIYGIGSLAEITISCVQKTDLEIVALFDGSNEKHGKKVLGFEIMPPETINQISVDAILITAAVPLYITQINKKLSKLINNENTIVISIQNELG